MSKWNHEKEQVLETGRKMLEKGLTVGTGGNLSLRLPPEGDRELLAITPSSRCYDEMTADDIQIIDFWGQKVEGDLPPSVEAGLHIGIYRARHNVGAIVHTHSVFAGAVAVIGLDIPPLTEDQVAVLGGSIRLAKHAPSGSRELAANALDALKGRSAVLLQNHGVVSTGRTLPEAFTASELAEKAAQIFILARSAGKVKLLPPAELAAMEAAYRRSQEC
jgi:L-fuculose-phosphate aldolase